MTHRPSRLDELLEGVRQEFEAVRNEALTYRLHRDENDHKFNQQTLELSKIKSTVFELEVSHRQMKDAYEAEIARLKQELEQKERQLQTPYRGAAPPYGKPYGYTPLPQQQPPAPLAPVVAPPAAAPVAAPEPKPLLPVVKREHPVPDAARAAHKKPAPAFLQDLDAAAVAPELKKQMPDYYVLYNPEVPRRLDVELAHLFDHTSVVCCVRFLNDGKFLATGCNKTTQVYNVETGELVARLLDGNAGETGAGSGDLYIRLVCFLPDGKFLATGAEDKLIRIWDLSTRRITKYLKGHEQDIYSLDFFPDGRKLISGSGDRTVRIWDLTSGLTQLTLTIEDGVTTVAVLQDGKWIAAGSLDRTVRVWDAVTGFLIERLDLENENDNGHKDSVYSVIFTGNGSEIALGSLDTTVKLWSLNGLTTPAGADKPPTRCEVTYVGHKDFVLSVCALPDGNYILSGLKDRGVIFWNKASGEPLLMLQGHRNSVISVSVANHPVSGSGMFATGSGDCKARIWRWSN